MVFAVVSCLFVMVIGGFVQAQDDVTGPLKFSLGADASFTDNRDSTAKGLEEDNTDIYIKPRVDALFDWGDSMLDLFGVLSYRYRSNAGDFQDTSKVFTDLGLHGRHAFTDRFIVRLSEVFKYTDDPTLASGGVNVTRDGTYLLNNLSGGVSVDVAPKSRLDFDVSWYSKQFDEDFFRYLDEDSIDGDVAFRQQVSRTVTVLAQVKARQFSYGPVDATVGELTGDVVGSDRDFDSVEGGIGVESRFRPDSKLSVYGGYRAISFKEEGMDDQDAPYASLVLSHQANAATVLRMSGEYGLRETAIRRYSVQEYSDIRGDIFVDVSKSITLGGGGIYRYSKYDEDGMTPAGIKFNTDRGLALDGNQTTIIAFGSVAYKLTEDAVLKLLYRYTTDDSDVSVDFDKNEAVLSFVQNF